MTTRRSNTDVFAGTLLELAERDDRIVVVTADSRGSAGLKPFADRYADRFFDVGIAEQTLVGVSAGLASCGFRVFAVSPAAFLTARAFEQIKNDVAFSGHAVKLVGVSAGVSYGPLGTTHHALHDLAALRAVPGLTIVAPADNRETAELTSQLAASPQPCYLRLGKWPVDDLPKDSAEEVRLGVARKLVDGTDVALLATGEGTHIAWQAYKTLEARGVSCLVLSMHTVSPMDAAAIVRSARACRVVVAIEEHCIHGGLGEACAAIIAESGIATTFRRIGLPLEHAITGTQAQILEHYGLSGRCVAQTVGELLNRVDQHRKPRSADQTGKAV